MPRWMTAFSLVFGACGGGAAPPPSTPAATPATREPDDGQRALARLTDGWGPCMGNLSDARSGVEARSDAFRTCYDARSDRAMRGQLLLAIHVVSDGRVDDVRVGGALGPTDVGACVGAAAREARFAPLDAECAVVVVPYTFAPPSAPRP